MIEEIKELLTLIQQVPDMVLHVLAGFAIYKTIVFLGTSVGIYSTIRFVVAKWHDFQVKKMEKPQIIEHKVGEFFITHDGTYEMFMSVVSGLRNTRTTIGSSYIHKQDVQYLLDALNEKKERERKV